MMIALLALIVISIGVGINLSSQQASADSAATSVTVGNAVPSLGGGHVAEAVASANGTGLAGSAGNPINVGSSVTLQATATDANGDQYKLLVCNTGSLSGVSCADDQRCVSGLTNSGAQASCDYTGLQGDPGSVAWFGFVCDAVGCSSADQGSGDSGSPLYVNHAPSFTAFSDNSPKVPGVSSTFSTTALDDEAALDDDYMTLYVCSSASFGGGATPGCGATTLCSSTAATADPTCYYNISNPTQDSVYPAYGYIVDGHGLVAPTGGGSQQGVDAVLTVSNVAPVVSGVVLKDTDGSGNLTLTEEYAATTGFTVTYTVTDNNSCLTTSTADEISSGKVFVYRSGLGYANCSTTGGYNANSCYPHQNEGWTHSCVQDAESCTGATDSDATWTCTFSLQYHADPTDTGATYAAEDWDATIIAVDNDTAGSTVVETASGVDMGLFMAYDLSTTTLAYGTLAPGADSDEATINVSSTGNVGLDVNLTGSNMCTDYDTCSGNIIVAAQQVYNLTAAQGWGSGVALATSAAEAELNAAKTTVTATPAGAPVYFQLRVPAAQAAGAYTGQNTIEGITSESAGW